LRLSAQLTSALAVPLLLLGPSLLEVRAGYAGWLALLWLALAWVQRAPGWFTAFQAALSGAVLFAVTAWIERQSWLGASVLGLADPRALHAYGLGLGLLGLGWVAARRALRSSDRVRELWQAPWPALDRVVLGALVVGQLALAAIALLPAVLDELVPAGFAWPVRLPGEWTHAFGPGAWLLLALLAGVLLAALTALGEEDECRARSAAVLGLLLLAVTVPFLWADRHAADLAAASALRWGLAGCFLACSALLWLRSPLTRLAGTLGIAPAGPAAPRGGRGLLVGVAGLVLLLTGAVAYLGFTGLQPSGPLAGSAFARLGWTLANVVPLALLAVGLTGTALRERSPGYAFAAGLVANFTLTGGYALAVVTAGAALDAVQQVRLVQLASLGAGLWALAWLLSRPWIAAWRERPAAGFTPRSHAGTLMLVQLGMALAGNAGLLAGALLDGSGFLLGRSPWAVAAGSPLGWLALLTALAALAVWCGQRRESAPWALPFAAGTLLPLLLACAVARAWPDAGNRALLLSTAAYGLLWALAPFVARRWSRWSAVLSGDLDGLPAAVGLVHALTAAAGLAALSVTGDLLGPAAALALLSAAWGLLAVARSSEGLALGAGVLVNLAVSLVTIHVHRDLLFADWWVSLVLANVAASAAVALLWLAVRARQPGSPGPLLGLQSALGLAGFALLALAPLGALLLEPGAPLDPVFRPVGTGAGWLALLLASAAAWWHAARHAPRRRLHALALAALLAGVLAGCLAQRWDVLWPGLWLSFHVLSACWALLALGAITIGSVLYGRALVPRAAGGGRLGRLAALFPARSVRRWLEVLALGLVLLALRSWDSPGRPLVPAATAWVACLLVGALALWFGHGYHVYASGLLLNFVGLLLWARWGEGASFLALNALCLALGSAFWSAVEVFLPRIRPAAGGLDLRRRGLPFRHFAALAALGLMVLAVGNDLIVGRAFAPAGALDWGALAALGLALGVALWDRGAWFARGGLYVLGLAALGLALQVPGWTPAWLGWHACLALALYVTLASLVCWAACHRADWLAALRLPAGSPEGPWAWFLPAQGMVAGAVLVLSLWVCLDFVALAERLAGPLAVLLLLPGAVLLAETAGINPARPDERAGGFIPAVLRRLALALGAVAGALVALAWPDPAGPAAWLQRSAWIVTALVVGLFAYAEGLPRWLRRQEWTAEARRLGLLLGSLAVLLVPVLLLQELLAFDRLARRTPLGTPAVAAVLAALAALMVGAIRFACVPRRDPLGLSEKGRTAYVYIAEVLLVFLFVHLRLNVPELFLGILARYWTLAVMLLAFLGIGLGEYFEGRGLRVLAGPLRHTGVLLPLVPLLAFWARPPAPLLDFAGAHAPGLGPMLGYLEKLPRHFDAYALLWFLAGTLYTLLALSRGSLRWALVAALAVNFGVWSLLAHSGVAFLAHPQAWLIPLALIVLVSEHVNRERLTPTLAQTLRYLGICTIYVASTADLFLAGLGNSVWLPVVLAALAVAGVLAGILLRVRAFLFLGAGFLFVDVFTMIWHAAVDRYQTWVWWVSGIVLGAAILTLFALFEKRRNDVLRLVEQIKRWD
jgi:hypothetical protein